MHDSLSFGIAAPAAFGAIMWNCVLSNRDKYQCVECNRKWEKAVKGNTPTSITPATAHNGPWRLWICAHVCAPCLAHRATAPGHVSGSGAKEPFAKAFVLILRWGVQIIGKIGRLDPATCCWGCQHGFDHPQNNPNNLDQARPLGNFQLQLFDVLLPVSSGAKCVSKQQAQVCVQASMCARARLCRQYGSLIIGTEFWGPLYYNHNKEPPHKYLGPYIRWAHGPKLSGRWMSPCFENSGTEAELPRLLLL